MRKQTDKSFQNTDNELQQIQKAISEFISNNVLFQKLAQEFDELYKKHLSSEIITDYYEETLESNTFIKKKTDTLKQIIVKHKTLS